MIYMDRWGTVLVCDPQSMAVGWFRRNIMRFELWGSAQWPWWIRREIAVHIAVGDGWDGTMKTPSLTTLKRWQSDGGCEATDGCWVEPDGTCEHGCESWLLVLGMI